MDSVLILSKKCATGEVLFSFGRKKFEKFDFRTGPKKSSNYSDFTRRIFVFCKSGLLQEVVTEGASTVYRLVV